MTKEMSDEMIYQNLFAEYPDVVTVNQIRIPKERSSGFEMVSN